MRFSKTWSFFKGTRWKWSGSWSFGVAREPEWPEHETAEGDASSAQAGSGREDGGQGAEDRRVRG